MADVREPASSPAAGALVRVAAPPAQVQPLRALSEPYAPADWNTKPRWAEDYASLLAFLTRAPDVADVRLTAQRDALALWLLQLAGVWRQHFANTNMTREALVSQPQQLETVLAMYQRTRRQASAMVDVWGRVLVEQIVSTRNASDAGRFLALVALLKETAVFGKASDIVGYFAAASGRLDTGAAALLAFDRDVAASTAADASAVARTQGERWQRASATLDEYLRHVEASTLDASNVVPVKAGLVQLNRHRVRYNKLASRYGLAQVSDTIDASNANAVVGVLQARLQELVNAASTTQTNANALAALMPNVAQALDSSSGVLAALVELLERADAVNKTWSEAVEVLPRDLRRVPALHVEGTRYTFLPGQVTALEKLSVYERSDHALLRVQRARDWYDKLQTQLRGVANVSAVLHAFGANDILANLERVAGSIGDAKQTVTKLQQLVKAATDTLRAWNSDVVGALPIKPLKVEVSRGTHLELNTIEVPTLRAGDDPLSYLALVRQAIGLPLVAGTVLSPSQQPPPELANNLARQLAALQHIAPTIDIEQRVHAIEAQRQNASDKAQNIAAVQERIKQLAADYKALYATFKSTPELRTRIGLTGVGLKPPLLTYTAPYNYAQLVHEWLDAVNVDFRNVVERLGGLYADDGRLLTHIGTVETTKQLMQDVIDEQDVEIVRLTAETTAKSARIKALRRLDAQQDALLLAAAAAAGPAPGFALPKPAAAPVAAAKSPATPAAPKPAATPTPTPTPTLTPTPKLAPEPTTPAAQPTPWDASALLAARAASTPLPPDEPAAAPAATSKPSPPSPFAAGSSGAPAKPAAAKPLAQTSKAAALMDDTRRAKGSALVFGHQPQTPSLDDTLAKRQEERRAARERHVQSVRAINAAKFDEDALMSDLARSDDELSNINATIENILGLLRALPHQVTTLADHIATTTRTELAGDVADRRTAQLRELQNNFRTTDAQARASYRHYDSEHRSMLKRKEVYASSPDDAAELARLREAYKRLHNAAEGFRAAFLEADAVVNKIVELDADVGDADAAAPKAQAGGSSAPSRSAAVAVAAAAASSAAPVRPPTQNDDRDDDVAAPPAAAGSKRRGNVRQEMVGSMFYDEDDDDNNETLSFDAGLGDDDEEDDLRAAISELCERTSVSATTANNNNNNDSPPRIMTRLADDDAY